jgi:hypothetical protein
MLCTSVSALLVLLPVHYLFGSLGDITFHFTSTLEHSLHQNPSSYFFCLILLLRDIAGLIPYSLLCLPCRSLAIASNAGIKVSPHDICYGLQERLITIRGNLDNQLQAIFLILSEFLEDDRYPCSYAGFSA